ncbi:phosphotransferase [Cohnella sp. REN36]|uniref:phosphotransferase n=1 Tax=Cohnella sp. REN36 TaxID=2887347 RepID=UPI001D15D61F|nr:phosphotransferase [Cohnella sp. REN36]MCC3376086.1 phosphotransferase [Cohnella sp. REN36]
MTTLEAHFDFLDLQAYVSRVLGNAKAIRQVYRMHGGAQKVVYRIDCADGSACVLYVWDLEKNYFQEEILLDGPDERAFGGDSFERANRCLSALGIRTPALYDLNRERSKRYPFDYALVEYVAGPKAEHYLGHPDAATRERVFGALGDMLARMHGTERAWCGKPDCPDLIPGAGADANAGASAGTGAVAGAGTDASADASVSADSDANVMAVVGADAGANSKGRASAEACHMRMLANVKPQLAYAAAHMARIGEFHARLLEHLESLAARIAPRGRYGLIHGELGPDHVLVNDRHEPYLIDIEGAEFMDIEHEHSFLEFRFGEDYRYLRREGLDADRMAFYRFRHHLSLIAGGLKLLHRGFPDQAFARGLADHHAACALRSIEVQGGGRKGGRPGGLREMEG